MKNINTIENVNKKFIHVCLKPIDRKYLDTVNEDNTSWLQKDGIYHNPLGLWIGCGDNWMKWIGKDIGYNQWTLSSYIYNIIINDTVLRISSVDEFKSFVHKYKKPDNQITIGNIIDWNKLKQNYNGLVICPYLGNDIFGKKADEIGIWGNKKAVQIYYEKLFGNKWKRNFMVLAEFYRHWETGSGVIWHKDGISDIILLHKINSFVNILDNLK